MADREECRACGLSELTLLLAQAKLQIQNRLIEAEEKYGFDFLAREPLQGQNPQPYVWVRMCKSEEEEENSTNCTV
jgi:hypothetical protein